MISKTVLCHILVIWGLAQVTAQVSMNRPSIPAGVRSSMIANGWRPLSSYEGKPGASHSSSSNLGPSSNERRAASHPVHGKLHEHMASSEKLSAKQNKQSHDYNPPSILGSFSVFGHSMTKVRPNGESLKSHPKQVAAASETREFSFLVPPPREPVRYDIDPYRKIILRDNEAYLRQPQQYIISHSGHPQTEIRNSQFFPKGSGPASSASTHSLNTSKNRPIVPEYNGVQSSQQQHQPLRPQHIPFESLKLSNAKLYLQPPSANGPLNFASEQQATENLYDRYPSSLPPHNGPISHDGPGNFYSQINHPSPSYKTHTLERDPSFLVHESHEVSYPTPASPGNSYANFRPSSPYESLHPPERYSTTRPVVQSEKFVPSKPDNVHRQQQNGAYGSYGQNNGNLDNTIITSDQNYANGIANTYYITEQQSLTPPPPTWSIPGKTKVTSDINEVLPKTNRPAKFNNEPSNVEQHRQSGHQQVVNYLFPRPEIQQPQQPQQQAQSHYSNPLALINQEPEVVYETPESISLKHFNEQQFRLQQQLLQRDRDLLREQELQRQQEQIDLGRITAVRNQEKAVTTVTRPTQETSRPTVEYYETTVNYGNVNQGHGQVVHEIPPPQIFPQEYQTPYQIVQENFEPSLGFETENGSLPDISSTTTEQPLLESTEAPTGHRNRPRKPSPVTNEQQHRRRKPTTTTYEDRHQQQYLSTLSPKPIVHSVGSSFSYPSSTEASTIGGVQTISLSTETTDIKKKRKEKPIVQAPGALYSYPTSTEASTSGGIQTISLSTETILPSTTTSTTTTTTTPKPRTRRPSTGSGSGGRRRRPSTTTTQQPDTTIPITYEQRYEDLSKYEKIESEASRRRRIKPSTTASRYEEAEESPMTSTEKKRYEIQNYGIKLGNEQYGGEDFVTENQSETDDRRIEVEQVSQQSYGYNNEQERDALFYTPNYNTQVTTGQEATEYETSGYPTSPTIFSNQGSQTEYQNVDHSEAGKNVYTNIPLEELFINTEKVTTTTTTLAPTTTTNAPRRTTSSTTRVPVTKSTGYPSTSSESVSTRNPSHRMRPMRFGNTTRPRFSIKDYKSRLDYRSRMSSTTSESPVTLSPLSSRQKLAGSNKQDLENQPLETTTSGGRYRHMSRVSYRISSTTPSYHSRRTIDGGSGNSTTERLNKFAPKRRLHNNHLYRSKVSTSTTADPTKDDVELTTSRQNSVRHENVFSSSIRRRPQMKHSVYTQSSDIKSTRKESTEMVPEETSFYSPAYTQLLMTETRTDSSNSKDSDKEHVMHVTKNNEDKIEDVKFIVTPSSETEISVSKDVLSVGNFENQSSTVEGLLNAVEYSQATTASINDEVGPTEALIKSDNFATVNSQLEEDLFAKASQSVADLTSSASALYDKPGMFKAVSVSPSAGDSGVISSRFKIGQEKPTLPIEAFFHELSNKN